MKVLVTGGAGYIGSHVCKALAMAGHAPVAFDNLSGGHNWAVRWGPLVKGDVRDMAAVTAALQQHEPDAVMHFAGRIEAGLSTTDPGAFYDVNVAGSLALLQAMNRVGVRTIVFSSTAAVYGEPKMTPIPESHVLNPISPYGRSKLMVEQMLEDFGAAHGFRYAALRYFNAAGADPDGEIGEAHEPETHLIPLVLDVAITPGSRRYDAPASK